MDRGLALYRFDWDRWPGREAGDSLDRLVLAIAPATDVSPDATGSARLRRLVADPAYQLK